MTALPAGTPTLFALWPRWAARTLLGAIAVLVLAIALQGPPPPAPAKIAPDHYNDILLYRDIVRQVGAGADYYAVAATQHRAHLYPTAPAPVFREPTTAWMLAALRTDGLRWAVLIWLAAGVAVAERRVFGRMDLSPRLRLWSLAPIVIGLTNAALPGGAYVHEIWASLLIALSLALRRPGHFTAAIAVGLAACLVRELALPYLVIMAVVAAWERRWSEVLAWTGAALAFGGLYAAHLSVAGTLHRQGDRISEGWVRWGGWRFVLSTAQWNGLLAKAPDPVTALALCASLVGLAGRRDPWSVRALLILGAYLAAFAVVGRTDNLYWGILYAPLLPLGWLFAPAAFSDLGRRAGWAARIPPA